MEEKNLVEALKKHRPDQVHRALKLAGTDIYSKENFEELVGKLSSEELTDLLAKIGVSEQTLGEILRNFSQPRILAVLKYAEIFPFNVEYMIKSYSYLTEAAQAQLFSEIGVSDPSVFSGFNKYSSDFKQKLMKTVDYIPGVDEIAGFMRQLCVESKRQVLNLIEYQPTPGDIIYAFRDTNPENISTMLHSAGINVYPLEEDCVRTFRDKGHEFANRVFCTSGSLANKATLELGLKVLSPLDQQQVIACVGIQPPLCEPLLLETLKHLRTDEVKRSLKEAGFSFDSVDELTEVIRTKSQAQQEEILNKSGANFCALTEKGIAESLTSFSKEKMRQILSMSGFYPPTFEDSLSGFKNLTIDKQREFLEDSRTKALPTEEQLKEGFQAINSKGDFLVNVGYVPSKNELIQMLSSVDSALRREILTTTEVSLTPKDVSMFLGNLTPQEGEEAILASEILALPSTEMISQSMKRHTDEVIRKIMKSICYIPDGDDIVQGLQACSKMDIERIFRLANIKPPSSEESVTDGLKTLRPDESHRAVRQAEIGNPTIKDMVESLKTMSDHEQLEIVKSSGMAVIPATETAVADFLKNKLKAKQRQILKTIDFPSYLDLIEIVKDLDLVKQWQLIEDAHIDYYQRLIQDSEKLQVVLIEGLKQCTSVQQAHIIKLACDKLPGELLQYYLSLIQVDERRRIYQEVGPYPNEHSSLCELVQIVTCMSPKDRYDFLDMIVIDDLPNDIVKKTLKSKRPTEMQDLMQELQCLMEPYGPLCRKEHDKIRCFVIDYLHGLPDVATKEILKLAKKCLITLLTVPPKDCVPVEPVTKLLNSMPEADTVEAISKTELQLRAMLLRHLLADVAVRKLMNYPSIEELVLEIVSLKTKDQNTLMQRILSEISLEQFISDDILLKVLLSMPSERKLRIVTTACDVPLLYTQCPPSPEIIARILGTMPTGVSLDVIRHSGNCELIEVCSNLTCQKVIDFIIQLDNVESSNIHDSIWSKNGIPCIKLHDSAYLLEIENRLEAKACEDVQNYKNSVMSELETAKREIESSQEAKFQGFNFELESHIKSECCRLAEKVGRNLIDSFLAMTEMFDAKSNDGNYCELKSLKAKKICDEIVACGIYQAIPAVTHGISDLVHEYCNKVKDLLSKISENSKNNENTNCNCLGPSCCNGPQCLRPPQGGDKINNTCQPCGGSKIMCNMNDSIQQMVCGMDELFGLLDSRKKCGGNGCNSGCCQEECREIIERERDRFRSLEAMLRETVNETRGTAQLLIQSEVEKRKASDEDHVKRQMNYREDKEREIDRMRCEVFEMRTRFERDMCQKEIALRDELERRKQEHDCKIEELMRQQNMEMEALKCQNAEFNRNLEHQIRSEAEFSSNNFLAEIRQNLICEFEKELCSTKLAYEEQVCQVHSKYKTEVQAIESSLYRVIQSRGIITHDDSGCADMTGNMAVLARVKQQVHEIGDYTDWLNRLLEETKCREKQLRDFLEETRCSLQVSLYVPPPYVVHCEGGRRMLDAHS